MRDTTVSLFAHSQILTSLESEISSVYRRREARGASEFAQVYVSMTDPAPFDDTANDHERLEAELLAQDRDVERIATADVPEKTARHLVRDLLETDVVTPVPEQRVLVHEPSGNAFDSITQLAVFHRGWTAACDASEEAE